LAVLVEDSHVAVGDEEQDPLALVRSADADVDEPALVAQGQAAGVDAVVADPEMGVVSPSAVWRAK
jgi:hypothetical protein